MSDKDTEEPIIKRLDFETTCAPPIITNMETIAMAHKLTVKCHMKGRSGRVHWAARVKRESPEEMTVSTVLGGSPTAFEQCGMIIQELSHSEQSDQFVEVEVVNLTSDPQLNGLQGKVKLPFPDDTIPVDVYFPNIGFKQIHQQNLTESTPETQIVINNLQHTGLTYTLYLITATANGQVFGTSVYETSGIPSGDAPIILSTRIVEHHLEVKLSGTGVLYYKTVPTDDDDDDVIPPTVALFKDADPSHVQTDDNNVAEVPVGQVKSKVYLLTSEKLNFENCSQRVNEIMFVPTSMEPIIKDVTILKSGCDFCNISCEAVPSNPEAGETITQLYWGVTVSGDVETSIDSTSLSRRPRSSSLVEGFGSIVARGSSDGLDLNNVLIKSPKLESNKHYVAHLTVQSSNGKISKVHKSIFRTLEELHIELTSLSTTETSMNSEFSVSLKDANLNSELLPSRKVNFSITEANETTTPSNILTAMVSPGEPYTLLVSDVNLKSDTDYKIIFHNIQKGSSEYNFQTESLGFDQNKTSLRVTNIGGTTATLEKRSKNIISGKEFAHNITFCYLLRSGVHEDPGTAEDIKEWGEEFSDNDQFLLIKNLQPNKAYSIGYYQQGTTDVRSIAFETKSIILKVVSVGVTDAEISLIENTSILPNDICIAVSKLTDSSVPTFKEFGNNRTTTLSDLTPSTKYVVGVSPSSVVPYQSVATLQFETSNVSISVTNITAKTADLVCPSGVTYLLRQGIHPDPGTADDILSWGTQTQSTLTVLPGLQPSKDYTLAYLVGVTDTVGETLQFKTLKLVPENTIQWVTLLSADQTTATFSINATAEGKALYSYAPTSIVTGVVDSSQMLKWKDSFPEQGGSGKSQIRSQPSSDGQLQAIVPLSDLMTGVKYNFYASIYESGESSEVTGPTEFVTEQLIKEAFSDDDDSEVEALPDDYLESRTFAEEVKNPLDAELDISMLAKPQYLRALFHVQKFNPDKAFGAKRDRVWCLDFYSKVFANLRPGKTDIDTLAMIDNNDKKMTTYPHDKLFRCEKDPMAFKRVRVRFHGADHPYDLVFQSPAHRQRFYECAKALRNGLVWAPSLCPIEGEDNTPHCFQIEIQGTARKAGQSKTQFTPGHQPKIKCTNSPTEACRIWTGCISLMRAGLQEEIITEPEFLRWIPKNSADIYVVGFVDVPTEYQGSSKLCDILKAHLGHGSIALLTSDREKQKQVMSVSLYVIVTSGVPKISNTGAAFGGAIRKSAKALQFSKVSMASSDAVALSFQFNETTFCFVCTKLQLLLEDDDDTGVRNTVLKEVIESLHIGNSMTDISSRFHHLVVLGSLAYPFEGDDVSNWPRMLSELPQGTDVLSTEVSSGRCLAGFTEPDLEMLSDISLEHRILVKSHPYLSLTPQSYRSYNVGGGRPAVSMILNVPTELVFLETLSTKISPPVSLRLENCMLTCGTMERASLVSRIRGASRLDASSVSEGRDRRGSVSSGSGGSSHSGSYSPRRRSLMSIASVTESTDEFDLGGKPGLQRPFISAYADFAEGLYRSATLTQDVHTGLPSTNRFLPMEPSTFAPEFLSRQHIVFNIHNDTTPSREAIIGDDKYDPKRFPVYASAVLSLKDVMEEERSSFCLQLYQGCTQTGGTITGIIRLNKSISTDQSSVETLRGMPVISDSNTTVIESVIENERKKVGTGWGSKLAPNKDPPNWCDERGIPTPRETVGIPDGWVWEGEWKTDISEDTDPNGWKYATDFNASTWVIKERLTTKARKRRWIRVRVVASKATAAY